MMIRGLGGLGCWMSEGGGCGEVDGRGRGRGADAVSDDGGKGHKIAIRRGEAYLIFTHSIFTHSILPRFPFFSLIFRHYIAGGGIDDLRT